MCEEDDLIDFLSIVIDALAIVLKSFERLRYVKHCAVVAITYCLCFDWRFLFAPSNFPSPSSLLLKSPWILIILLNRRKQKWPKSTSVWSLSQENCQSKKWHRSHLSSFFFRRRTLAAAPPAPPLLILIKLSEIQFIEYNWEIQLRSTIENNCLSAPPAPPLHILIKKYNSEIQFRNTLAHFNQLFWNTMQLNTIEKYNSIYSINTPLLILINLSEIQCNYIQLIYTI